MLRITSFLALVLVAQPLVAQRGMGMGMGMGGPGCCMAGAPVVEITGVVGQVRIAMGQGMPSLEVKHGDVTSRVFLGPLPYLIAQDFNPKSGQEVVVKGCKQADGMVAFQVTLPREKKTLKLRDENG